MPLRGWSNGEPTSRPDQASPCLPAAPTRSAPARSAPAPPFAGRVRPGRVIPGHVIPGRAVIRPAAARRAAAHRTAVGGVIGGRALAAWAVGGRLAVILVPQWQPPLAGQWLERA